MPVEIIRGFMRTLVSDRELRRTHVRTSDTFERLYCKRPDPWGLAHSPLAHQRYLRAIEALAPFTPCGSILDVGCGEGHFTQYLAAMAPTVVAIDVSPSAITRASNRVAGVRFECAGLHDYQPAVAFDVVTAVEMLYYVMPVASALDRLLKFGRTIVVTYSTKHRAQIEPVVTTHPHLIKLQFCPFFNLQRFGFTIAHFRGVP